MRCRIGVVSGALLLSLLAVGGEASAVVTPLQPITVSASTGEKPQSKVWLHDGRWWTVLPSTAVAPTGTWVWRLEAGGAWTNVLRISSSTAVQADVKRMGDVVHVLLHGAAPQLVSLQYVAAGQTYEPWTVRPTATAVTLAGSETATIDVDSTGRMWLATESGSSVHAYYSDPPYSAFTGPIALATNIAADDIAVVTALPNGTVGVLWSNQNTRRFGFRVHVDGADPSAWGPDEVPAAASALDVGLGMADDHLNLAVASDGTLYAAVKTSYDTAGYPKIALLVRRPDGTWDPLHQVDQAGTRGIVLLNETTGTVRVVYTSSEGYNDIVFKESAVASIAFGARQTLMTGGVNDATSTKERWTDAVVILAAGSTSAAGVLVTNDAGTTTTVVTTSTTSTTLSPFGDLRGHWPADEGSGTQLLDVSGNANDAPLAGGAGWGAGVDGLALMLDGTGDYAVAADSASLDISGALTIAAWIRPGRVATQSIVTKAINGATDGYELTLATSSGSPSPNKVFMRLNQATSGDAYRVASATSYPSDGVTWMHVAGTFDGATMRIYVNGVLEASIAGPAGGIALNATGLGIGAQSDGARTLQGALDDVRVYARALSGSEIAALAAPPATTTTTLAPTTTTSSSSTSTTAPPTTTSTTTSTSTTTTSTSTSMTTSTSTSTSTTASSSTTTTTEESTTTTSTTTTSTTLPVVCAAGVPAAKHKLTVTRLSSPAGDEKLSFKGEAVLPTPFDPALDPAVHGVRILIEGAGGRTVVDAAVDPGGYDAGTRTGWKVNGSATAWTYKNPGTHPKGITVVGVKRSASVAGLVKFKAKGKEATYVLDPDPAALPLRAWFVLDPPTAPTGQCADASFLAPPSSPPRCIVAGSGSVVRCR